MKLADLNFCKKNLNKGQKRMCNALEFLVRLLLMSVPIYLLIGIGISSIILMPLQSAVASQTAWVLGQMGFTIQQNGIFLSATIINNVDAFHFMINQDCTGWKSLLFVFSLIFAVPGIALRKRLWGLVFGLPIIWIGNLARVVGVVLVEKQYGVQAALMIHDYFWQVGLIALVLGIWLSWLYWVRTRKKKTILERIQEAVKWRT